METWKVAVVLEYLYRSTVFMREKIGSWGNGASGACNHQLRRRT